MTSIIIYLIGCVLSFILGRYFWRRISKESMCAKYSWFNVVFNIFVSLFSYIGLFAYIIVFIVILLSKIKITIKEPPKWL